MNDYVNQALLYMNVQPNDLIINYFSDANMQIIQSKLKREVKRQINVDIDNQSCVDIYYVMLNIYDTYGQNKISDVKTEIEDLNSLVISTIVPTLVSNVLQYVNYLKDISSQPVPMSHGESTSIKGTNSLQLKEF